MSLHQNHYFTTKDLVTIAGVASMGGVASTYLGYMGHLLGAATGIPLLSQLTVGFHVLWLVLILALLNKVGSGLLCALVDNLIQFLMGSHIGLLVLPIGILQGILAEIGFWTARRLGLMPAMLLAGGLSSIAHILFFQTAFHQFGPLAIALGMGAVAFVAGAFLGGLFPYSVAMVLQRAAVAKVNGMAPEIGKRSARK